MLNGLAVPTSKPLQPTKSAHEGLCMMTVV